MLSTCQRTSPFSGFPISFAFRRIKKGDLSRLDFHKVSYSTVQSAHEIKLLRGGGQALGNAA